MFFTKRLLCAMFFAPIHQVVQNGLLIRKTSSQIPPKIKCYFTIFYQVRIMFLRTPVIFQFHHSNSFKKLFTLRKTQHSSNHKHSSLHKILHPQPSRLAPSEKYSLLQTYHINFPFQNKYKTPVFYTFC